MRRFTYSITLLASLLAVSAWAQSTPPTIMLQDEGVRQGPVQVLNCTGSSLTCSKSGMVGTIDATGGGTGAPTASTYITQTADAGLSAEQALGVLATGCLGSTTTTGVVASRTVTGTVNQITVTNGDCSANPTLSIPANPTLLGTTTGTFSGPLTGNASTASALAANGANCVGNNFALGVDASGVGECAQPAFSNLSGAATDAQIPDTITLTNLTQVGTRAISDTTGTLAIGRGGTGQTTITTNQIFVGTALDTLAAKTLPSCSNATTSKLLFDNATQTFSCGVDQGGAGVNVVEVSLNLGTEMGLYYSTSITGQSWVTSSSVVTCSMFGTTADGQTVETIAVAGLVPTVSDRVVGTGFNVNIMNPNGATGTVRAHCHGV